MTEPGGCDPVPEAGTLEEAGLGLERSELRLATTTAEWIGLGADLANHVGRLLSGFVTAVEHVGSTSVPGLLAKPILDVAVGLESEPALPAIVERLKIAGWIHRGDAGEQGGHVFVLESRPDFRVAHLHVVRSQGPQWRDYLTLRDLLRRDPTARRRYAEVKHDLHRRVASNRPAYTDGKTEVVRSLLGGVTPS